MESVWVFLLLKHTITHTKHCPTTFDSARGKMFSGNWEYYPEGFQKLQKS